MYATLVLFVGGVVATYLCSQPGLEWLKKWRRQISWRQFQRAVEHILSELHKDDWAPDVIVGLNSGIVPASILALNLRIQNLYFYDVLPCYRGGRRIEGQILDKGLNLAGKNVLLIDDQAYTGRSLDRLAYHLVTDAAVDPGKLRRHSLFIHNAGAGPIGLDFPAYESVRGHVKRLPWVIDASIKPFWSERE